MVIPTIGNVIWWHPQFYNILDCRGRPVPRLSVPQQDGPGRHLHGAMGPSVRHTLCNIIQPKEVAHGQVACRIPTVPPHEIHRQNRILLHDNQDSVVNRKPPHQGTPHHGPTPYGGIFHHKGLKRQQRYQSSGRRCL